MKKLSLIILCVCLVLTTMLTSCGKKSDLQNEGILVDVNQSEEQQVEIDVDLTKLSSTMVYSEVYNMMANPMDYVGKTVKAEGIFDVYYNEVLDKNYYVIMIADAAACCQEGLEFIWNGDYSYPNDYPEMYSTISIIGTVELYEENGSAFLRLACDTVEKLM